MSARRRTGPVLLVWLIVCAGLWWWFSESPMPGWWAGLIVAASVVLGFAVQTRHNRIAWRLAREWFSGPARRDLPLEGDRHR